jgi:hypothetical protein
VDVTILLVGLLTEWNKILYLIKFFLKKKERKKERKRKKKKFIYNVIRYDSNCFADGLFPGSVSRHIRINVSSHVILDWGKFSTLKLEKILIYIQEILNNY